MADKLNFIQMIVRIILSCMHACMQLKIILTIPYYETTLKKMIILPESSYKHSSFYDIIKYLDYATLLNVIIRHVIVPLIKYSIIAFCKDVLYISFYCTKARAYQ